MRGGGVAWVVVGDDGIVLLLLVLVWVRYIKEKRESHTVGACARVKYIMGASQIKPPYLLLNRVGVQSNAFSYSSTK